MQISSQGANMHVLYFTPQFFFLGDGNVKATRVKAENGVLSGKSCFLDRLEKKGMQQADTSARRLGLEKVFF